MFEIERVIGSSHIGPDGNIRTSSAVDLFQDCCGLQLDCCPVTQEFYKRCNAVTFLLFRQMDFIREVKYGQKVTIGTEVFQMKGTYGMRNTIMYDEDGNILIACYGGGANVNRVTGKPEAIPKDLLAIYPLGQKYEGMEYLPRKISLPKDISPEIFDAIPVHRYQIDFNGHVNNARYLDIAEDYLPEDFKISRCRIAYKRPAKYEDLIVPVMYRPDDERIIISLQDKDMEPYVNIEYTKKDKTEL